jgi:hypothetical protein
MGGRPDGHRHSDTSDVIHPHYANVAFPGCAASCALTRRPPRLRALTGECAETRGERRATSWRCSLFDITLRVPRRRPERIICSLFDAGLLLCWESLIKFQIQLQHVDSRFSEDPKLPAFCVFR